MMVMVVMVMMMVVRVVMRISMVIRVRHGRDLRGLVRRQEQEETKWT